MEEKMNLDDVELMAELDKSGMLKCVEDFPDQCEDALRIASEAPELPDAAGLQSIAVLGMGGSGISGDITKALLEKSLGMPVQVHKGYGIPGYYGPQTLVFAMSYSGETEETLSAVEQATSQGCRIVAVTAGGTLLERSRAAGFPVVTIPGGFQPRAAVGYLSLPIGVVLERAGLVRGFADDARGAVAILKEKRGQWGRAQAERSNFAKQLARRLYGSIPVLYGSEGLLAVAVYRWKCQLNEIAKIPAFWHVLPELDHNEIVGWKQLPELTRRMEALFLVAADEHPRVAKRVDITADLIRDNLAGVGVMHVGGRNDLEKLFSAMYLGDFVSCYLALLNGEDPTPVERISELKRRMAEEPAPEMPDSATEDI